MQTTSLVLRYCGLRFRQILPLAKWVKMLFVTLFWMTYEKISNAFPFKYKGFLTNTSKNNTI